MLFLKDHHVSQVNRNPSCIIDIAICEEIGDHQSHRVHSGTAQFPSLKERIRVNMASSISNTIF